MRKMLKSNGFISKMMTFMKKMFKKHGFYKQNDDFHEENVKQA